MRHKRHLPQPERSYGWPVKAGAMPIDRERPSFVHWNEWIEMRTHVSMCMAKLKRAARYLQPVAFVATYPDGSYLLDPQWSRERAAWHKRNGARITRIRGVMEEW